MVSLCVSSAILLRHLQQILHFKRRVIRVSKPHLARALNQPRWPHYLSLKPLLQLYGAAPQRTWEAR